MASLTHKWIKSQSRTELAEELEDLHPAELGKLLKAAADAFDKRTIYQHPDFGAGIDRCEQVFNSKES